MYKDKKLNTECPCCIQMMRQIQHQEKILKAGLPVSLTCNWNCVITDELIVPRMLLVEE